MEPETGCLERHVVLIAPEIHWNTGNAGRTCVAAGAVLHLIHPLGFSLDSRQLKRAGLDYWPKVALRVWDDFAQFETAMAPKGEEIALITKFGRRSFRKLPATSRLFLVFGSESRGLPAPISSRFSNATYYIPTKGAIRSLNLSTAVGIALYESLRGRDVAHAWRQGSDRPGRRDEGHRNGHASGSKQF
jgi:tRNA (cytidine/uridine-2'-O-)-methyltransferase